MERTQILNEIYHALCMRGLVANKGDFAKKIGYNASVVSSAMNGKTMFCTVSLLQKVCYAFPQVNREFIEKGTGQILNEVPVLPDKAAEPAPDIQTLLSVLVEQQELTRKAQEQTAQALAMLKRAMNILENGSSPLRSSPLESHLV